MNGRRPSASYGHRLRRIEMDLYRLSWVVDYHYRSSRQRHPRVSSRDTDTAGARRFVKRWEISATRVPEELK